MSLRNRDRAVISRLSCAKELQIHLLEGQDGSSLPNIFTFLSFFYGKRSDFNQVDSKVMFICCYGIN
jgi:hypothetical protein